jgi:hypothetical protein
MAPPPLLDYTSAHLHSDLLAAGEVARWGLKLGKKSDPKRADTLYFNPREDPSVRGEVLVQMCTVEDPLVSPFGIRESYAVRVEGLAPLPGAPSAARELLLNTEGTSFAAFAEAVDARAVAGIRAYFKATKDREMTEADALQRYKFTTLCWPRDDYGAFVKTHPGYTKVKVYDDAKILRLVSIGPDGALELTPASLEECGRGARVIPVVSISNVWFKSLECGITLKARTIIIVGEQGDGEHRSVASPYRMVAGAKRPREDEAPLELSGAKRLAIEPPEAELVPELVPELERVPDASPPPL